MDNKTTVETEAGKIEIIRRRDEGTTKVVEIHVTPIAEHKISIHHPRLAYRQLVINTIENQIKVFIALRDKRIQQAGSGFEPNFDPDYIRYKTTIETLQRVLEIMNGDL